MKHDRYSSKPTGRPAQKLIGGGKTLNISVLRFSVLPFILIIIVSFLCVSCEKEISSLDASVHAQMQAFYAESQGLMETSEDSVVNYYKKFAGFHDQHPECETDELFPPTVVNLENALDHYGVIQIGDVIIHSEWGGETHLTF